MLSLLAGRLVRGVLVVFGVVTLTFALLHLAPGNPVTLLLGPSASSAQVEARTRALGLDQPLPVQYGRWLGNAARGDLGESIATGRPVAAMLREAWPRTALLVALSLLASYLLGLLVGAIQATTRRPAVDHALSVGTLTLFAMPSYWLGLVLVMIFAWQLRWFPAFGATGLDADFLTGWARVQDRLAHLTLPLLTLTLIGVGGVARYVRSAMRDVREAPFVLAARARGLGRARVTRRHILRNALVPVVTLLGLSLPALFSGTVFIEAIFGWPGVGLLLVQAVGARDLPVVMAATTVSAILVVVGNLLADLLTARVDPRVRLAPEHPDE